MVTYNIDINDIDINVSFYLVGRGFLFLFFSFLLFFFLCLLLDLLLDLLEEDEDEDDDDVLDLLDFFFLLFPLSPELCSLDSGEWDLDFFILLLLLSSLSLFDSSEDDLEKCEKINKFKGRGVGAELGNITPL